MKEFAGILHGLEATCDSELGNMAAARQKISEGLATSNDRATRDIAAGVLARTGDIGQAQKLMEELAKEFPTDTMLNRVDIPTTQALIELQRNSPEKAIALLPEVFKIALQTFPRGFITSVTFLPIDKSCTLSPRFPREDIANEMRNVGNATDSCG